MIYKRATGIMLEDDVVTDVNAVSLQAETVNDHWIDSECGSS